MSVPKSAGRGGQHGHGDFRSPVDVEGGLDVTVSAGIALPKRQPFSTHSHASDAAGSCSEGRARSGT